MGVTPRPIDTEIDRVKAAVKRSEARLDELRLEAAGGCCPSCVLGCVFSEPADAQERRRGWLAILLEKRGGPGDADMARAVRECSWP